MSLFFSFFLSKSEPRDLTLLGAIQTQNFTHAKKLVEQGDTLGPREEAALERETIIFKRRQALAGIESPLDFWVQIPNERYMAPVTERNAQALDWLKQQTRTAEPLVTNQNESNFNFVANHR